MEYLPAVSVTSLPAGRLRCVRGPEDRDVSLTQTADARLPQEVAAGWPGPGTAPPSHGERGTVAGANRRVWRAVRRAHGAPPIPILLLYI